MTHRTGPDGPHQSAHRWLTRHQHALTHTLDDLLDVEAGLREILLHSHHDAATDNLDSVLDTGAGLAAILPSPETAPLASARATPHPRTDAGELLRVLSPADRMALRNHPAVKEASQALARDALFLPRSYSRERGRLRALRLARDLARAFIRDLVHARSLVVVRDVTPRFDRAFDLVRALDHALDRARALDFDLDHEFDHAFDLDHARALARDLARVHTLALLDPNRALDFDLALARARERAKARTRAIDHALHILDPDVAAVLIKLRIAEVGRAIGLALRHKTVVLDGNALHALLDDFTATDLSDVDLTGIDLSGIHWSEHTTRWPPAIDIEDLKTRSDEAPPGSGTWIIHAGTATLRNLAER
ncbi:hypothetical protein [Streptomyces sp. NPDC047070]|uniref:hypothetical protein n=1 Tax=Streptomyces sp. NPDC047070 TaxID=3154923 RepID=UPI003454EBE3